MPTQHGRAEEASVDLILDLVAQLLNFSGLTYYEYATPYSLYYRVGDIRIRVSDREPDNAERVWAREHGGRRCADREYIVAAAIGEEPRAAAQVVAEILDDLRSGDE